MILMNIYNFISAICQITSFLPLCCVFLVTSKTNCFGMGSAICQRTNCNALCSIIFLPLFVWILFFGGLETSLKYLGYSKTTKITYIINDKTTKSTFTINDTSTDIGYNNTNDENDTHTTDDGTDSTEQRVLRAVRLIGSKPNTPKMAYFRALPPEIVKSETLFQDYKKIYAKFKRKASEPLTATLETLNVNPLAFKHNPITLQPMPDVLQTPEKKQNYIRDLFRRYWHQGKMFE